MEFAPCGKDLASGKLQVATRTPCDKERGEEKEKERERRREGRQLFSRVKPLEVRFFFSYGITSRYCLVNVFKI